MRHIERIENRDNLRPFNFLTAVERDRKGRIKNASKVTIFGFSKKDAIKRFQVMTAGAEFIFA